MVRLDSVRRIISLVATCCAAFAPAVCRSSTEEVEAQDSPHIEEIRVTARKVEESIQDVPDAITAFSETKLIAFGVKTIEDVAALTPNLSFHSGDAFEAGTSNLTMRGIGTASGGWPSVSYIVDGVPQTSSESIQRGDLEDIERIEVLRGPQSALYGFNAIGGAINVITKRPTNEWTWKADLLYGNGSDRLISATGSGPIIKDKVLFRLTTGYRDNDGLIDSASNNLDLDFRKWKQVQGKLILAPVDNFEITLSGSWDKEHDGATYEDKVPNEAYADTFNSGLEARRAYPGAVDRTLYTTAAHLQWDLEHVSVIATLGLDHVTTSNSSSVCYDDPNDPLIPTPDGGAPCLISTAYGRAALPGLPIDESYYGTNLEKTVTSDVRIASRGIQPVDWTVGLSTLHRTFSSGFDISDILAPDNTAAVLYPNWDAGNDEWWGVYGQAIWHAAPKIDFTFAARYDDETYKSTQYTDQTLTTIVPAYQDGALVDTQKRTANAFQPKGQFSYHVTDDLMAYLTVSRGFRAGYFSSALYTLPEHTTNYEAGIKSTSWDHRLVINAAVFYINYADQQYYTNIDTPPYVVTLTVPKTNIGGVELETQLVMTRFLSVGASLGYLHTNITNAGGWSPDTPRFNGNAYADFSVPLTTSLNLRAHIDDEYSSLEYLGLNNTLPNPAKNFVNLRAGVQKGHYDIAIFAKNITDRREQTQAGVDAAGGFLRFQNQPRSYGGEIRVTF